jgi:S-methylmethionine-dependent homocysteine/selenocysteine methylase
MSRYLEFVDRFKDEIPILIDGATGTEAERRGVPQLANAWNGGGALSHPEIIKKIHLDYIRHGAEIVISNSFATSKQALNDAGLEHLFEEYNRRSVELAIEARNISKKTNILVAGSICYQRFPTGEPNKNTLFEDIFEQAVILRDAGADLLILEMMLDIDLTLITLDAALKTGLPVWVGLSCEKNSDGNICLLGGDLLTDCLKELKKKSVPLVNIMHTEVDLISECLDVLDANWEGFVGVYAHTGLYKNPEWIFDDIISPEDYAEASKAWIERKINIIGGCCGIRSEHIKCLNTLISQKNV